MGLFNRSKKKSLMKEVYKLHSEGKYPEALKCCDELLKTDLDYIDAWCNRGIILQKLEKHNEAITSFDKAIKLDPENLESWYSKGLTLGLLNQNEEALRCFEKALEIKPDYEPAQKSLDLIKFLIHSQSKQNNRKREDNKKENTDIQSKLF